MIEALAAAGEKIAEISGELIEKAAEFVAEIGEKINEMDLDSPISMDEAGGKSEAKDNLETDKTLDEPLSESVPLESVDTTISKVDLRNCPINDGYWDGQRGNSKWYPEKSYSPKKCNPEEKTWAEILNDFGIDGIPFKDGEPDFSDISKGNVEIDDFSKDRTDNFDKADIELAKQKGCTPQEVAKWREENKYTWHECSDMKTMQKVSSIIHSNVPHRGGIANA